MNNRTVYIVSAVRTPMGSFGGGLKDFSATRLGAIAIGEAVKRAGLEPGQIDEVLMGCVMQANLGQAPARQAAKFAGLPDHVIATTVNKVCASGMKAISQGAQEQLELWPHYEVIRHLVGSIAVAVQKGNALMELQAYSTALSKTAAAGDDASAEE